MIHEFTNPIPCTTPIGDAYIIYVKSNGMFENDEFCCVMVENGDLKHFLSCDIKIWFNNTYGIKKQKNNEK